MDSQETTTMETPTLEQIEETRRLIGPHINETPVYRWRSNEIDNLVGAETEVFLKLELFQRSGTFKARGALSNISVLSDDQKQKGVTAVSAGNHAIAVAYAAHALGVSAKVVMQNTANPARVAAAKAFGAEVVMAEPGVPSFEAADKIAAEEGRTFVHPFDGLRTILGTSTLGLETAEQIPNLDAVVVAIGGGGLAAGVATAVKLKQPNCQIYGVEPVGADVMCRSFVQGSAQTMTAPQTIADSLAPPMTLPLPYELCRQSIGEIVTVTDDDICRGMSLLFRDMKLAVEPAGAAATAALVGDLAGELRGKRVGVIICGANIDIESFAEFVRRGEVKNE